MANQTLTEVKHTDGFDVMVEVITLGIIPAPETISYVVEDKDSGDKNEFISKSDAISFMSSSNCKC